MIGNVFTKSGSRLRIDGGVDGTLNHRNLIGGTWTRAGQASTTLPTSLYLDGRPGYLPADAWPMASDAGDCANAASRRGARVANP